MDKLQSGSKIKPEITVPASWDYAYIVHSHDGHKVRYVCKFCEGIVSTNKGVTSNLKRHAHVSNLIPDISEFSFVSFTITNTLTHNANTIEQ